MPLSWQGKAEIHRRDNCICAYCGFRGHDPIGYRFLSVDHVIRRADKGTDDPANLVTACIHCNRILNSCKHETIEEKRKVVTARNADYDQYFLESIEPSLRRDK
jgi:5-methylcytosine-specific restriction endonuclease McrA